MQQFTIALFFHFQPTEQSNETCWKNHTKCENQDTLNLLFQLYLFCECDIDDLDRDLPTDLDVILNSVRDDSGICGNETETGSEDKTGNGNENNSAVSQNRIFFK